MITLKATKREISSKKLKMLRKQKKLAGVVYGPEIKNTPVELDPKEFREVYSQAGESSLISLEIDDAKSKTPVLIYDIQKNPLNEQITHVDFYQPILTKEVEAMVPLVFEQEAPAVKNLGGTLIKEFQEVKVKALPQDLPHEIKVNVAGLESFEDEILIKDLALPKGVKILRSEQDIVASVLPPRKVEEELEEPIEEKVEQVEKVEKKEKPKEEEIAESAKVDQGNPK